jgi:predicted transcriptional regulator YdeE
VIETSIRPPDARHGGPRRVAGLAVRTRNADEMSPDTARIAGLWGRFMSEDWVGRLGGWSRVWEFFSRPGARRRAFTADLEVYDADGGGLEIWVAVEQPGSSRPSP